MTLSAGTRPLAGATAVPFTSWLRPRFKATWQNLARDRGLDTAIAATLEFERGERMLAADRDAGGGYAVVATDRALYHRAGLAGVSAVGARADGWTRLGWEEVALVGWDAIAGRLIITGTVSGGAVPADAATRTVVPLRRRGIIPELVLERVAHTRLGRWQLRAGGTRRAVIEARRRPATGELVWSVTYPGNRDDPEVRARAERAVARLSAELGALPQPGLPSVQAAIGRPRSGGTGAAAE